MDLKEVTEGNKTLSEWVMRNLADKHLIFTWRDKIRELQHLTGPDGKIIDWTINLMASDHGRDAYLVTFMTNVQKPFKVFLELDTEGKIKAITRVADDFGEDSDKDVHLN